LFRFGYGLSSARVRYRDLTVKPNADGTRTARVTVTNRGRRAGTVVPQLYLHHPAAAGEAPWNLNGFEKLRLAPRASRTVSFRIDERTLRVYGERTDGWQVVPGSYTVAVGSSARDLRDSASFDIRRR
jgi:beta-glucosidase